MQRRAASRPISLVVIASLQLMMGMEAVLDMVLPLFRAEFRLDTAVIFLWSGFGLLRWSDGWRWFSVFVAWLTVIICPLFLWLALTWSTPVNTTFRVFGHVVGHAPGWLFVVAVLFFLGFAIWEIRVLSSREICQLFWQRSMEARIRDGQPCP
jgi:hypothetical protein